MKKIERFDKYMKYKGLNDNKVTIQLALSVGTLGKSRKSDRDLSDRVIEKILNFYTDLNRVWLLTGDGEMLNTELKPQQYYGGNSEMHDAAILPLIPYDVLAGSPNLDIAGITLDDCERYAVPEFTCLGAEFLIRVSGDSMFPRYNNGDILACKKISNVTFIQWGKVYVIDTTQGILVKNLFPSTDEDKITCHSVNTANYPDFDIPKADIRSFSLVLGVIALE